MNRSPLEEIPGVGPKLARVLHDLGVRCVDDLKGQDPETLYDRLTALRGRPVDRCVLYVFRCAVYYAQDGREPRRLKWWHWKDSAGSGESHRGVNPSGRCD
ncbi:MAG: helix-hairpin-helix domain-containing protein [Pirellulales bacterium]